jgi:hypothetical protein
VRPLANACDHRQAPDGDHATVATAATYRLNHIRPGGYRIGEYLMLAAISALIGGPARAR